MGLLKTYPLMYIAADEKDAILVRTNIRKSSVYMYPAKATPDQARLLFVDMMDRMNNLAKNPEWYNTFTANCTSSIAEHVNKIWPGRLPWFSWQTWVTGFADRLVFDQGLIDTDLNFEKTRQKYYITTEAQRLGNVPDFSEKIREYIK